MNSLARQRAGQARVWGAAPWQNIAKSALSAVHEEFVVRRAARPGEPWLDLAAGTGAVALRAARARACVNAVDLSSALATTAERLAAKQRLAISFTVGDAERLHYPDESFDVVSSMHGVVFAADHRAVARQLAPVCMPGGRVGLTYYWRSNSELQLILCRRRAGGRR